MSRNRLDEKILRKARAKASLLLFHVYRVVVLPFLSDPLGSRFIFVVGCYNSGTTLLNYLLGEQEQISALPTEGVAVTSQLQSPEELGWNRMWHMCKMHLEISQQAKKPDPVKLRKEWAFWHDRDKPFWVEKSIVNAVNIDWFEKEFSHPFFIWIVRNGYAVAEGIRRRSAERRQLRSEYKDGYPIGLCARQWLINNQIIEQKTAHVKNMYRLTYEALCADPNKEMEALLNWLPVSNKSVKMPTSFTFHDARRPILDLNQESIKGLAEEQIREINSIAGSMLADYGYEIL